MDSSQRHWPSMFKSKTCNTHHDQWQHDINSSLISTTTCHKSPFPTSVPGSEERSPPEPKPRWNPKPEQIRILEAIFNSGMVNPPRDEIRRIRAQLQEYGQVGDANVFYWFQNRKSRSKHKQRHLQTTTTKSQTRNLSPPATSTMAAATAPPSSSDKSSQKSTDKAFSVNVMERLNSPTGSVNQPYFHTTPREFSPEPYYFPVHQTPITQGFSYPELSSNVVHHDQMVGNCSSVLTNNDMMNLGDMDNKKIGDDHEKIKVQQLGYSIVTTAPISAQTTLIPPNVCPPVLPTINHIQGAGEGPGKSTVFINDVAFEVAVGPFNVREAFGDDAVLLHSSGQPVVTNEWGVTLQSLQHGVFYYLVRMLAPSTIDRTSMDLI